MASPENILSGRWPGKQVFFYNGQQIEFICKHSLKGASQSLDNWEITYITYDTSISADTVSATEVLIGQAISPTISSYGWTI